MLRRNSLCLSIPALEVVASATQVTREYAGGCHQFILNSILLPVLFNELTKLPVAFLGDLILSSSY